MKKKFLSIFIALVLVLSFSLVTAVPVGAAPPADNPGKGPPEFDKVVFVHYEEDFALGKPPGTPGKGGGDKELYSYSRIHWADGDIPVYYWINLSGSSVAGDVITGITAAFDTWEDVEGSYMDFDYRGTTTEFSPGIDTASPDYQNVVGWADLEEFPNAIAVTVIWYIRGKRLIVDCDTALNTDAYFLWTQADGIEDPDGTLLPDTDSYDVDVQNIMTHEAGHWLMLNDLYYDAAIEQTMYGWASDRELKKRSLDSGDIAGIQKIYD
ncbi:hypothetical protein ES708_01002 [subsurface metagenome]